MAVSSHEIWALGHLIMLGSAIRIFIAYTIGIFGKAIGGFWYKAAYLGALLSYSIVVYKSLGVPSLSNLTPYMQRALMDDNVQYALLAMYWAISKPVYISLIPFATFSLFHVLTFLRTNIIPKFFPASTGPPPTPGQARPPPAGLEGLNRKIQVWVKSNYDTAMRFVAYTEVFILLWTIGRAVSFVGSFLTPLFLFHFIRMRYFASPFTREAIGNLVGRVDSVMANSAPPAVANGWTTLKNAVNTWLGGVQHGPGGGGGPAAPARGARPAAGAAPAAGAPRR